MEDSLSRLGATIKTALGVSVTGYEIARGELTMTVKASDIVKTAIYLKTDPACQFICIIDITAVDWPAREMRFECMSERNAWPDQQPPFGRRCAVPEQKQAQRKEPHQRRHPARVAPDLLDRHDAEQNRQHQRRCDHSQRVPRTDTIK
jgi:hypothetical protein